MGSVVCELLPASRSALKTMLTTDPLDMHFEVILWKLSGFLQVCIQHQPVFTSLVQWWEEGNTHSEKEPMWFKGGELEPWRN